MDAANLSQFPYFNLVIPAWQMGMYVGIISLCMLVHADKLSLIVTYLFTLYWGYFVIWGDVLQSIGGSSPVSGTWFLILGTVHVILTLITFFREP